MTSLQNYADPDCPPEWCVNEEPDDPWADDDFGPLNIRDDDDDIAALLRVRESDVRREVAQRFEAVING